MPVHACICASSFIDAYKITNCVAEMEQFYWSHRGGPDLVFSHLRGPQLCPRLRRTGAHPGVAKAGAGSTTTGPLDHAATSVLTPRGII